MTELNIEVEGMDKMLKAFERFPREVARAMSQAGHEAANKEILPTSGLRNYPPAIRRKQSPISRQRHITNAVPARSTRAE